MVTGQLRHLQHAQSETETETWNFVFVFVLIFVYIYLSATAPLYRIVRGIYYYYIIFFFSRFFTHRELSPAFRVCVCVCVLGTVSIE